MRYLKVSIVVIFPDSDSDHFSGSNIMSRQENRIGKRASSLHSDQVFNVGQLRRSRAKQKAIQ